MRYVVAACAAGALLSLLVLPSAPLHDQWAWIVWGRELVHLDLDASAGPAWKPLPVMVTALLAPFGAATPSLWLAVARFGGLLSLALGWRLAARLASGPEAGATRSNLAAGWPAGVVAVIALLSAWLRNVSLGIAEGLLVAFSLWAVERHVEGRRGQALVLVLAASLIRPEAWPFLGLYSLYLWLTEPRLRVPVAAALLSVPLLWFGPDTFLAGEPLRSSDEAQSAATTVSAGDVLSRAFDVVPLPVHLAALVAVALAVRRRATPVLVLAAAAAAYVVVEVVLTVVGGYEGVSRFLYPVLGIEAVLAGVGVGWLAEGAAAWAGRRSPDRQAPARVSALAAGAIVVVALPLGAWRIARLVDQLRPTTARHGFYEDLATAVTRAGGAARVRACGTPYASVAQAPAVAWRLHVHIPQVRKRPSPPGSVLRVDPAQRARIESDVLPVQIVRLRSRRFRFVGGSGPWQVLESCRRGPPTSRS